MDNSCTGYARIQDASKPIDAHCHTALWIPMQACYMGMVVAHASLTHLTRLTH